MDFHAFQTTVARTKTTGNLLVDHLYYSYCGRRRREGRGGGGVGGRGLLIAGIIPRVTQ